MDLRLKLVTNIPVDGLTKPKLMLNSTQVGVGVVCFIPEVIQYFYGWVAGWLGKLRI